ncbi:hypothetical protein [Komarekiella delphini-convector]|uniref:hypothetical protein n=1 Tax=Komarekiella delphini-convector TaxID=3050158 RepID=UPI001CD876D1|nr:hypothetical protein [Komarekiella delphini-convector]
MIARQEVELRKAKNDYERYKTLLQEGAVSLAETETRRLQVEIEEERLQEAKANLSGLHPYDSERVKTLNKLQVRASIHIQ